MSPPVPCVPDDTLRRTGLRKKMANDELKVGDVVTLKSGGPKMRKNERPATP
jgi:uncharacterized protein DUF2158